jgi:exosortase/archaeosortase
MRALLAIYVVIYILNLVAILYAIYQEYYGDSFGDDSEIRDNELGEQGLVITVLFASVTFLLYIQYINRFAYLIDEL